MKKFSLGLITAALALASAQAGPNELSSAEQAAGWKLLFDGKTTNGWRSFKKNSFPAKGWVVEDGWLKCIQAGHGGALITLDEFENFEFSWDWRIRPRANNGIKYFVTESRDEPLGHEYQMVDDAVAGRAVYRTAAFYDVLPPSGKTRPNTPGEINHSRVLVRGNHVEHWLNGDKVLEYQLGSDEVKAAIAKSKFKDVKDFGTKLKGHILLTEHGGEAAFRDLKIRVLPHGKE
jgi:hypothetical protein